MTKFFLLPLLLVGLSLGAAADVLITNVFEALGRYETNVTVVHHTPCKTITTLSTNVVVDDNRPTRWVNEDCPITEAERLGGYRHLMACGRNEKYGEATEKTETQIVTEIKTKECRDGDDVLTKEIGRKELFQRITRYWLKPAEWIASETYYRTNPPFSYYVTTNFFIGTNQLYVLR